ncbi:hypothetical protein B0H14DRAFT_3532241 [Mycena olivaceomarginata]|nr:hypothetical protein B0H14DRAFT_3532241 [Mycena olivaceomarginata]
MYEFYPSESRAWIRIRRAYVQIVRTDQPFLVRRVGVVGGVNQDSYITHLHPFLDLPSSSISSANTPNIEIEDDADKVKVVEPPTKRANVVKIDDDDDDEVEIIEDDDEVELVEPSSRRRNLSASPTLLSENTSDSTASTRSPIRSLSLRIFLLHYINE